mgnify:CR=1 FL=1
MKRRLPTLLILLAGLLALPAGAQIGEEILPPSFTETLLDLPDDAAQAARAGKRLLINARPASGSTAVGGHHAHDVELEELRHELVKGM